MSMSNSGMIDSATVSKLQDLLSINIDSQKGFQEAAEATKDISLRQLFSEFERKRAHNAAELRQLVAEAGQTPTSGGSVSATLHRWWIDAKQALTGNDAESILSEAERGEDSIKHTYEESLPEISNSRAREVVERQFKNVKEGHDRVKQLRESYRLRNPRG
jgi:uncharacterized protein (TIGR02284 family)